MNILIAEDEDDIRNLIKLHLTKKGFNVYDACNGQDAYNIFNTIKLDLAILDVMMPLMDGVTLLKNIRKSSRIPVIFLTARSDDSDKILGLKLGADDYMIKPFNPAELTARVYAQLRRYYQYNSVEDESTYTIGDITVDSNDDSFGDVITHDGLWKAERGDLKEYFRERYDLPEDEEIHILKADGMRQVVDWQEVC